MRSVKTQHILTAILTLVCLCAALTAARAETVPVQVSADSMRYDPTGNLVTFEGNVHVVRPDFQIWAASIEIHFQPQTQGEDGGNATERISFDPGDVTKIVALGGVRMTSDGRTGTCGAATYYVADGLFQMNGDPVLTDGKNRIEGKTIRYFVKSNRSEVLGGDNKRVNATFAAPEGFEIP